MPTRLVAIGLAAVLAVGAAAFGVAFAAGNVTSEEPAPPPPFGVPAVPLDLKS